MFLLPITALSAAGGGKAGGPPGCRSVRHAGAEAESETWAWQCVVPGCVCVWGGVH